MVHSKEGCPKNRVAKSSGFDITAQSSTRALSRRTDEALGLPGFMVGLGSFWGIRFRVEGTRFRVSDLGFRVLGFRV